MMTNGELVKYLEELRDTKKFPLAKRPTDTILDIIITKLEQQHIDPFRLVSRSPEARKAYIEGWNNALARATQILGATADVTLTLNKWRMW